MITSKQAIDLNNVLNLERFFEVDTFLLRDPVIFKWDKRFGAQSRATKCARCQKHFHKNTEEITSHKSLFTFSKLLVQHTVREREKSFFSTKTTMLIAAYKKKENCK